jgi:hypothetical protein
MVLSRVQEAAELTRRCPAQTRSVDLLHEYILDFKQRVAGMSSGDVMLVPGGWLRPAKKRKGSREDGKPPPPLPTNGSKGPGDGNIL